MLAKHSVTPYNDDMHPHQNKSSLKGENTMSMTRAEITKKHHSKLDEFKIRPYLEEGKKIREYAESKGMSINALFMLALKEYMENHKDE